MSFTGLDGMMKAVPYADKTSSQTDVLMWLCSTRSASLQASVSPPELPSVCKMLLAPIHLQLYAKLSCQCHM